MERFGDQSHPYADHIGLTIDNEKNVSGASFCSLSIDAAIHHNPHHVTNGAVIYALADIGMGAALYPLLAEGQSCATIEIKISYFRPAQSGTLICTSKVINKGKSIANLESRIMNGDKLVAHATGNFAVLAAPPALR